MIKKRTFEMLTNVRGNANISFPDLVDQAQDISAHWEDSVAVPTNGMSVRLTPDASLEYTDIAGRTHRADVSDYAFAQLCSKAGIPAAYITKCLETGRQELAMTNFLSYAPDNLQDNLLVRKYTEHDGTETVRAVLTDRYNVFDSGLVMDSISDVIELPKYRGRYECNQAFLNEDRLHLRFVDFNQPLRINNDKLFSGFTVSSSDVGSGALTIKYFIYRFACRNGLVVAKGGGTMFRQTHLREFELNGVELFSNALEMIDKLNEEAVYRIIDAQSRKLDDDLLEMYLSKAQHALHFGKKGKEGLLELLDTTYDRTKWGVINALTEQSQQYTLEDRIAAESFAGAMLGLAA